jgi:hypothetical protein
MAVIKREITYPRHWFFSCNKFTCYVQTDEDNKVANVINAKERSRIVREIIANFAGQPAKNLQKHIQRKFGGLYIAEFNEEGKPY